MPRLGGDPSSHRTGETMNIADVTYLPETAGPRPRNRSNQRRSLRARAASRAPPTRSARAGRTSARCPSSPIHDGAVIASVRMTRVAAGEGRALLLGPLAVRPAYKNLGIGRRLVRIAVEAAEQGRRGGGAPGRRRALLRPARLQASAARPDCHAAAGRPRPYPGGRAEARRARRAARAWSTMKTG